MYGDLPDLPKSTINSKSSPSFPLCDTKISGEQYAHIYHHLYNVPTVCLRFFNVYGPKQNPNSDYSGVLSILNAKFINKEQFTFYGDGEQTRDFVYIDDLVSAIWTVLYSKDTNGGIFNVGAGSETSLNTVLNPLKKSLAIPFLTFIKNVE